jgi:hypothetical protein
MGKRLLVLALFIFALVFPAAADVVDTNGELRLGMGARVLLRFDPAAGAQPGELTLRAIGGAGVRTIPLTARDLGELRALVLDPGRYSLEVEVTRHRRVGRELDASEGDMAIGTIVLPASPAIRGTVVERKTAKPLAGVRVAISDDYAVETDARGRFELYADGEWPADVVLLRRGFGTKRVALPAAATDVELETIALARGATLRLEIERGSEKGPLTVRIAKHDVVKTASASENVVVFDDLDGGAHPLLIEGDEPLKRLSMSVFLTSGESRTVHVQLPGGHVYGRFTLGSRPLAAADLFLTHDADEWRTKVTTDADGLWQSAVWRRGDFNVSVTGGEIDGPPQHVGTLNIPEGLAPRIDFDVPDRRVTGKVIAADGSPIADVTLALETMGAGPRTVRRVSSGRNGEFVYLGVRAGKQALRVVTADGRLRPETISFQIETGDQRREVKVVLKDGARRTVEVVDHHGVPRGDAVVLCVAAGEIRSAATTDSRGEAAIETPLGEASTLYVVPREGSLVSRPIAAGEEARGALALRIPPASVAIDLVAKETDGTAVPEVAFLMRFNGEIVPPEVVREMQRIQGARLFTDEEGKARLANLPTGFYEFWPYRSDDEIAALLETAGALDAPIGFNARVGENRVTVRFERRH